MKRFHLYAAGAAAMLMLSGQSMIMAYASQSPETDQVLETAFEEADSEASETESDTDLVVVQEGIDEEGISWKEREVPFKALFQEEVGSVILRFYEDMPNVAYVSYESFHEMVQPDRPMEVTEETDGVYTLTCASEKASIDTKEDTISYEDYYAFTDTSGPSESTKIGVNLDGAPFARYGGAETKPGSGEVVFEFAGYHIDLRKDGEGVYIPFTTLSNLYEDSSFLYRAVFNLQEVVFCNHIDYIWSDTVDPQWYESVLQMKERPADLAAYSYSQLCFALEHFYGYPGQALIDETIMKEQGLDAALKACGEIGENASRLLQSTDMSEYFAGSERLRMLLWDGDHTNLDFLGNTGAMISPAGTSLCEEVARLDQELEDGYQELVNEMLMKAKGIQSSLYFARHEARQNSLGEGTYFTKGNTAWCVFDEFKLNKDAWDAYYASEEKNLDEFLENTQDDSMVILLSALQKAQDDPKITNFVVDMSQNPGGNDGVAAAVESLLTGNTKNPMIDMLTGREYATITEVDRNFDGVFDEKDDEVSYDLHFAVLISEGGYSNGTICPSVLKDNGVLTLGEKTRGGCCCLQCLNTAEGIEFLISSSRVHHLDQKGNEIDAGLVPEIDLYQYDENGDPVGIERELDLNGEKYSVFIPDYSFFYDIEAVGKRIDEYYAGYMAGDTPNNQSVDETEPE